MIKNYILLEKWREKKIHQINCTFLYYGYAIEPTILTALNDLATYRLSHLTDIYKKSQIILDCLLTYADAKMRSYVDNTNLHIESNVTVKADCGGIFHNCNTVAIWNALIEMGHPRLHTKVITDNLNWHISPLGNES